MNRALRTLDGSAQAQSMLDLVLKLKNATERGDAALTLDSIVRRSDRTAIAPVLVAYWSAAHAETGAVLLDVMSQMPAPEALPVACDAPTDSRVEIGRAAILGLTAW